MRNLAGEPSCDAYIKEELTRCGIPLVTVEITHPEVKATLEGQLGSFRFRRNWFYYSAKGYVPLSVSKELYKNYVGKKDIRVSGHCGGPPPEDPWLVYYDEDGNKLINDPDGKQEKECLALISKFPNIMSGSDRFVPSALDAAKHIYVDLYHIDSELGLYIFVETLKKHNLV